MRGPGSLRFAFFGYYSSPPPFCPLLHKFDNRYGLSFEFPFVSANIHAPTGLTPSITSLNGTLLAVMYVTGDVQMMQAFGGLLPVGIAQV